MNNSNEKKAVSAGVAYTLGNIFIKGLSFLTLPIFTRFLTTEEFGVYNVFISYGTILCMIIGLAINSSIRNSKLEFGEKIDEYVSSITLIYIFNTVIISLFVIFFGSLISVVLNFKKSIVWWLLIYSFVTSIITLYNSRLVADYSYIRYLGILFFNSLSNIVVSLILITTVFSNQKDLGRIIGVSSTSALACIYILFSIYKTAKPTINKKYWKFAIKYSLPVVPHEISQVLLNQFDRVMIRNIISSSAAGIYSFAFNIKLIITIITDSITSAWHTWFFEEMEKESIEKIKTVALRLTIIFMYITIIFIVISPELIFVLGGVKYDYGKYIAIPMIIDGFILFVYNIIVVSEYYKKKTLYIMYGTVTAAIIDIVTNYIFIKKYGFLAAAYTTLFSYVCYLVLHIIISKRVVGFYILSPKIIFLTFCLVCLSSALNLFFINNVFIRYAIAFFSLTPVGITMYKKYNLNMFFKEKIKEKLKNKGQ